MTDYDGKTLPAENRSFAAKAKSVIIGHYDWKSLCTPYWPWCRKEAAPGPQFFPVDEKLSISVAAVMGLQHALAMCGGIITPPILVSAAAKDIHIQQYLVSSALIFSGICTFLHVLGFRFGNTGYQWGTGIISVIGISFTFINVTIQSMSNMMKAGDTWSEAYSRILGTLLVCAWLTVALSFMPPKLLRRIFPPLVTGSTIFLIGAGLIGTGLQDWGGGSYCAEYATGILPATQIDCMVTGADGALVPGVCYEEPVIPLCSGNGNVELKFGSAPYIGLGAIVFLVLILIELFGSPFMRNCEVIIGLLIGYLVAACVKTDGNRYVTSASYDAAPGITFLWTTTFGGFGFYAPAVLPYLIGILITTVECIGDITASEEASMLKTTGPKHSARIQGGLFADGINTFTAALAGVLPCTTFAQNNGVIALSRCASRYAGFSCGIWLFLFGVLAKFGAFWTSVPNCVLGGMTTFLFTGVSVSGLKIITHDPLSRRNRFILCVSLGLGLGITLVPSWAQNNLWILGPNASGGITGFRDAIILVLSNGFTVGALSAIALHLMIPFNAEEDSAPSHDDVLPATARDNHLYTDDGTLHSVKSLEMSKKSPSEAPDVMPGMERNGRPEDSAHGSKLDQTVT
eukprot:jgi/Astpho2/5932/Aster-02419